MIGSLDCLDWMAMTEVSVEGFISECQQGRYPGGSLLQTTQSGLGEIFYYNIRTFSRGSLMIATIVLVETFNLPDAGNSTQRETVQEVPGVFISQRRKGRDY